MKRNLLQQTLLMSALLLGFFTAVISPAHAARTGSLVDGSFSPPANSVQDASTSEEETPAEEAPVEEDEAELAVPAAPPPPPAATAPAAEEGPVIAEPAPVAADVPSKSGSDVVTLLVVAAGGFAVGILAGVMGCCLLFFAYY